MKPREERQKVMIRARMRVGASWHDACILNLSRRGLGIQASDPPLRGTYVEICRGSHVIVARVMWSKGHRAGLQAQDTIMINALISEPAAAPRRPAVADAQATDRRRAPRPVQHRHDRSRIRARALEFACIAIAGAGLGMVVFGTVQEAFAKPLSQIRAALGPG